MSSEEVTAERRARQVEEILRALEPEDIDMLRDAFIAIDTDSDGLISAAELKRVTAESVGEARMETMGAYVDQLFAVADTDKDGYLNLIEFMGSFGEGVGVVPAEVVSHCVRGVKVRLSDDNITAIQENFHRLDRNGDGYLDTAELRDGLKESLAEILHELSEDDLMKVVALVMGTADQDRDGRLSLSEFIRSYQEDQGVLPASYLVPPPATAAAAGSRGVAAEAAEDAGADGREDGAGGALAVGEPEPLTEEEVQVLRSAFEIMDRNNDGFVEFSDLYDAIIDTLREQPDSESQLRDLCDMLVITADRIRRGRMTVSEFVFTFVNEFGALPLPNFNSVQLACQQLRSMHASGELGNLLTEYEDRHSDVPMNRVEMVGTLCDIFAPSFPEWDEYTLDAVMTAIVVGMEVRYNNRLSLDDFIQTYQDGPGIVPLDIITSWERMEHADSQERRKSVTVEDLETVKAALRRLERNTDDEGNISTEQFYQAISETFPNDPLKIETMYTYVLNNLLGGGDEEEEEGDGGAGLPRLPAEQQPAQNVDANFVAFSAPAEDPHSHSSRQILQDPAPAAAPATASAALAASAAAASAVAAPRSPVRPATATAAAATQTPGPWAAGEPETDPNATLPKRLFDASVATTSSGTQSPRKSRGGVMDSARKPSYQVPVYDTMDHLIEEDELRELFDSYDTDGDGFLDREEFKKVYRSMENFGLEPSAAEIDAKFRRYSRGSDRIGFDEFSVLMLQRVRM